MTIAIDHGMSMCKTSILPGIIRVKDSDSRQDRCCAYLQEPGWLHAAGDYNVPPLEGVLGVAGGVGRPRLRVGPAAAPARLVAGDTGSSSPSMAPLTEAPSSPSSESVQKPPEFMTTQGNHSS